MNKKMIIALSMIAVGALLFISAMAYILWDTNESEVPPNEQENTIIVDESETDEDKKTSIDDFIEEARNYTRLRMLNTTIKYLDQVILINEIEDTEENLPLFKYYEDILFMSQLETQSEYGFYDELIENIRDMNDPENFFISLSALDFNTRIKLIVSSISLLSPSNPKIENVVISTLAAENDVRKHIQSLDNDLLEAFEMKVTINDENFIAFIAKNYDGFYLYELNGETENMITVQDWLELSGGLTNEN